MNNQTTAFDLASQIADSPSRDGPTREILDSLQTVLSEFEAIASDWLRRLDNPSGDAPGQVAAKRTAGKDDQAIGDLNLPAEQISNAQEFRQVQDQLIDAWHRLESEQLQFALVQRQSANQAGRGPNQNDKMAPSQLNLKPAAILAANCLTRSNTTGTCSDAIRQFHRLRCEMESLKSPQIGTPLDTETQFCGD